jgi:hypothetical protein
MTKKSLSEQAGVFHMSKNLDFNDELDINYQIQKSKQEKDMQKANELLLEAEKKKQEEINKKLERLEMIPLGKKIIIQPYPVNPYRKILEGNIYVDYQGEFKNPDSGEWDKQKSFVACAKVIEVGPECEYLLPDDDIYYDTRTTYPMPFMSLGHLLTTEPQVLSVINEGLTERFKNKNENGKK